MTPDEIIKVVQAYKDGKKIQSRYKYAGPWADNGLPEWNFQHTEYRVKPEPRAIYKAEFKENGKPVLAWHAYEAKEACERAWIGDRNFIRAVKFVEEINNDE